MKKMLLVLSVSILALSFHIKEADAKSRGSSGSRTSSSYSSSSSSKSSSGSSYSSSSSYKSGVRSYKPSSSNISKKSVPNVNANGTTNKAKVTDKATSITTKNKINLKKAVPTKTPIHQDISTGANQTKKNSVSTSLKKLNYAGPKPDKSKLLYTALGAYLLYQYTEDDGEPVYVDVETGDEIEMDEVGNYDEVEFIPDDVDVNEDIFNNVDEFEKFMQQMSDENKQEDGFSDKHPIVNNILVLIFVLIPAIGLFLIGKMFFGLLFMK
ncbi:hypothetical protein [Priestia megaterium]|uniref:hypothetical protein n=1 Tax=Priestia megaterium TaxID=1404 RepID=UPI001C12BA19|nr:hypothetical protein [Priestia megaterium]